MSNRLNIDVIFSWLLIRFIIPKNLEEYLPRIVKHLTLKQREREKIFNLNEYRFALPTIGKGCCCTASGSILGWLLMSATPTTVF